MIFYYVHSRFLTILLILTLLLHSIISAGIEPEFVDQDWIHILRDQPNYFLFGQPEVKAQLSIKVKLLTTSNFYFGYSQRIFWDFFKASAPFRDINYNPSLSYRYVLESDTNSLIDFIPYEHESNGKGGPTSRSWDRTGIRYQRAKYFDNNYKLTGEVRVWAPFNRDPQNLDIAEYRGIYEFVFTLSQFAGNYFTVNDLSLRLYPGGKSYINPLKGGRELTLRLRGRSQVFLANAVFQIFEGTGENMLEYNQTIWGLRAGIGI